MTPLLVAAGASMVLLALLDLGWTTIAAGSGGGPLTRRIARSLWRRSLALHRRNPSHALLHRTGPLLVAALFATWIALVFGGWSAVFLSAEGAVRRATTDVPADLVDRLYFTGYTVFTLGVGDYRPGQGVWQLVTVVATANGLVLVTLGITYLVPVASAVSQRRQLASSISGLGEDGTDIVLSAWNGERFGAVELHLAALASMLDGVQNRHLAYPVLHYFHSEERATAAPLQVVHLAQAVEAWRLAVAPSVRPDAFTLRTVDRALDAFLGTLGEAHIRPAGEPVAPVPLDRLRTAGIPTVSVAVHEQALEASTERRRLLAGLLLADGWYPEEVAPSP